MSELDPSPFHFNKFAPCGSKCHYVDAVLASPLDDLRIRHYEGGSAIVWHAPEVNDGMRRNWCGQHVEKYLNCNLAVYELDPTNRLLRQWERDVETGEDLEVKWEISLEPFFSDLFDLLLLNLWVHTSYGGAVAAHSGDRVAFYNVQTGDELSKGYLSPLHPENSTTGTPGSPRTNPQRFSDMMWFPLGFTAVSPLGNDVLDADGQPFDWGPPVPSGNLAVTFALNQAPFPGESRTPTYRPSSCGDDLWMQSMQSTFVHTPFARFGNIWNYGSKYGDNSEAGAILPILNRTTQGDRSDPCGQDFAREPPQAWRQTNTGVVTSAFCNRVYHWATIGNAGGEDVNGDDRILRYDIEEDSYQILGSTGFGYGFPDVVADTWPLPDGVPPEFRCVDRCRDAEDGDDPPPCCGPDDPQLFATFADTQYPEDCLSEPYPGVNQYAVHVSAVPIGCPGDRVQGIGIEVYGLLGGDGFAEMCRAWYYRDDFDDRIMYADFAIYMRPGECYEIHITATTEQGCRNEVILYPYISPPDCDIGGGTPIRLI